MICGGFGFFPVVCGGLRWFVFNLVIPGRVRATTGLRSLPVTQYILSTVTIFPLVVTAHARSNTLPSVLSAVCIAQN